MNNARFIQSSMAHLIGIVNFPGELPTWPPPYVFKVHLGILNGRVHKAWVLLALHSNNPNPLQQ